VKDTILNVIASDTIYLEAFDYPTIYISGDSSVFEGERIELLANGGVFYQWYPNSIVGDISTPELSIELPKNELLWVEGWNKFRCKRTDSVLVYIREFQVYVPEAFTPNGDGVNDILYVETMGIESIHFQLFNRWGELVFETKDKNIGWDGKHRNNYQHDQSLGWVLNVVDFKGRKHNFKGQTSIFR